MTRVAELARRGVAGTAAASVSLGRPQAPTLVAACSPLAQRADGVQLQAGEGPSLDAFVIRDVVVADDAWADGRWPRLGAWPVGEPRVHGVVAVPLLRNRSALGVLTLYGAAAATGWTRRSRAAVAPYAGRALSLALVERKLAGLAIQRDQFAEALTSRATIDQAK